MAMGMAHGGLGLSRISPSSSSFSTFGPVLLWSAVFEFVIVCLFWLCVHRATSNDLATSHVTQMRGVLLVALAVTDKTYCT